MLSFLSFLLIPSLSQHLWQSLLESSLCSPPSLRRWLWLLQQSVWSCQALRRARYYPLELKHVGLAPALPEQLRLLRTWAQSKQSGHGVLAPPPNASPL